MNMKLDEEFGIGIGIEIDLMGKWRWRGRLERGRTYADNGEEHKGQEDPGKGVHFLFLFRAAKARSPAGWLSGW